MDRLTDKSQVWSLVHVVSVDVRIYSICVFLPSIRGGKRDRRGFEGKRMGLSDQERVGVAGRGRERETEIIK